MGIPDNILQKPGPLTPEEWDIMKMHPTYARDMLKNVSYLSQALDIPYSHHEKWDGTGYPQSLHGDRIPLAARLFAIIDVWDALTSDRPYRKAWTEDTTLKYIQDNSGIHFDPDVVDEFIKMIKMS
jgi:putative two-component system response regulator